MAMELKDYVHGFGLSLEYEDCVHILSLQL